VGFVGSRLSRMKRACPLACSLSLGGCCCCRCDNHHTHHTDTAQHCKTHPPRTNKAASSLSNTSYGVVYTLLLISPSYSRKHKMADSKKTKDSVLVSPQAFVSMAMHAARHSTTVVHGVLIGSSSGHLIKVTDAIPVCHETPTTPLVETALALVQAQTCNDSTKIVGWFTAPEVLENNRPGPVALRIVANLVTTDFEPVLLVLHNEQLGELLKGSGGSASNAIQAFGKDFGKQWMEPLDVTVDKEPNASKAAQVAHLQGISINDLVDHWGGGASSEWHPTAALVKCLEKHS
jgi:hypothetical protein